MDFFFFFSFFVRIGLVQVKRGTSAAPVWEGNSVTHSSESALSPTDKSSQTGLFLRADGRAEWDRSIEPDLVYSEHAITLLT